MTQKYIDKNILLSIEFDKYIISHPELLASIPKGATIVITLNGDDEFNNASISVIKRSRSKRPVVEARKSDGSWRIAPLQLNAA